MTNTAETEYAELSTRAASVAFAVTQRVAELSDRSSPDDWPEAMLVTGDELIHIVSEEVAEVTAPLLAENARLREALEPFSNEAATWSPLGPSFPDSLLLTCDIRGACCNDCGENPTLGEAEFTLGDLRRARAALHGDPHLVQPQQSPAPGRDLR